MTGPGVGLVWRVVLPLVLVASFVGGLRAVRELAEVEDAWAEPLPITEHPRAQPVPGDLHEIGEMLQDELPSLYPVEIILDAASCDREAAWAFTEWDDASDGYAIRVHPGALAEPGLTYVLAEEWAHVLLWDAEVPAHGSEWAVTFGRALAVLRAAE